MDFETIYNEFLEKIKKIKDSESRANLLNLLEKLHLKKIDDEKKFEVFINILLQAYNHACNQTAQNNRALANAIQGFLNLQFGIQFTQLPDSLQKPGRLNLYSLLLENANHRTRVESLFFGNNVASAIGEKVSIITEPSECDKLIWKLTDYKVRLNQSQDGIFDVLFTPEKFRRDSKINVTNQLLKAIRRGSAVALTSEEREVLNEGELGEILKPYLELGSGLEKLLPLDVVKPSGAVKVIFESHPEFVRNVRHQNNWTINQIAIAFEDIFNPEIHSSAFFKTILDSFNKISVKNNSSQEKIEMLADMLIHKYSAIRLLDNQNDAFLADEISHFCRAYLGIQLPKIVEKDKPLTLATLILWDMDRGANDEPKYIKPLFAELIGKPSFVKRFDSSSEESCRERFILQCIQYKSKRLHEADSCFSLLFRQEHTRHAKLNVIKQLIKAVKNKTDTAFNAAELKALKNSRVLELINKCEPRSILPAQVQKEVFGNVATKNAPFSRSVSQRREKGRG